MVIFKPEPAQDAVPGIRAILELDVAKHGTYAIKTKKMTQDLFDDADAGKIIVVLSVVLIQTRHKDLNTLLKRLAVRYHRGNHARRERGEPPVVFATAAKSAIKDSDVFDAITDRLRKSLAPGVLPPMDIVHGIYVSDGKGGWHVKTLLTETMGHDGKFVPDLSLDELTNMDVMRVIVAANPRNVAVAPYTAEQHVAVWHEQGFAQRIPITEGEVDTLVEKGAMDDNVSQSDTITRCEKQLSALQTLDVAATLRAYLPSGLDAAVFVTFGHGVLLDSALPLFPGIWDPVNLCDAVVARVLRSPVLRSRVLVLPTDRIDFPHVPKICGVCLKTNKAYIYADVYKLLDSIEHSSATDASVHAQPDATDTDTETEMEMESKTGMGDGDGDTDTDTDTGSDSSDVPFVTFGGRSRVRNGRGGKDVDSDGDEGSSRARGQTRGRGRGQARGQARGRGRGRARARVTTPRKLPAASVPRRLTAADIWTKRVSGPGPGVVADLQVLAERLSRQAFEWTAGTDGDDGASSARLGTSRRRDVLPFSLSSVPGTRTVLTSAPSMPYMFPTLNSTVFAMVNIAMMRCKLAGLVSEMYKSPVKYLRGIKLAIHYLVSRNLVQDPFRYALFDMATMVTAGVTNLVEEILTVVCSTDNDLQAFYQVYGTVEEVPEDTKLDCSSLVSRDSDIQPTGAIWPTILQRSAVTVTADTPVPVTSRVTETGLHIVPYVSWPGWLPRDGEEAGNSATPTETILNNSKLDYKLGASLIGAFRYPCVKLQDRLVCSALVHARPTYAALDSPMLPLFFAITRYEATMPPYPADRGCLAAFYAVAGPGPSILDVLLAVRPPQLALSRAQRDLFKKRYAVYELREKMEQARRGHGKWKEVITRYLNGAGNGSVPSQYTLRKRAEEALPAEFIKMVAAPYHFLPKPVPSSPVAQTAGSEAPQDGTKDIKGDDDGDGAVFSIVSDDADEADDVISVVVDGLSSDDEYDTAEDDSATSQDARTPEERTQDEEGVSTEAKEATPDGKRFIVYGASWCPYTQRARAATSTTGTSVEVSSATDVKIPTYVREMAVAHKHTTLPIVVESKGETPPTWIGGATETLALLARENEKQSTFGFDAATSPEAIKLPRLRPRVAAQ